MSAVVTELRPYQSAVQHARRLGIDQREAVHAVAEARRQGMTGNHVAGQMQHRAARLVTVGAFMRATLSLLDDKPGPEAA